MKKLTILATDLQRLKKYKDEHHIKRSYEALTHLLDNYEKTIKLQDETRESLDDLCAEYSMTYDEMICKFIDYMNESENVQREKELATELKQVIADNQVRIRPIDTAQGLKYLATNVPIYILSKSGNEEDILPEELLFCADCLQVFADVMTAINHTCAGGNDATRQQSVNSSSVITHNTTNAPSSGKIPASKADHIEKINHG